MRIGNFCQQLKKFKQRVDDFCVRGNDFLMGVNDFFMEVRDFLMGVNDFPCRWVIFSDVSVVFFIAAKNRPTALFAD